MRSDDLRVVNRHRILQALRRQGSLSRTEIGNETGLSQAALSTVFSLMTEQGIVTSENTSTTVQKRGRPKTTVALDADAAIVVTVALAVDQLSFCAVNYAGETLLQIDKKIDTHALNIKQLFAAIISGVSNVMKPYGINKLKAISTGFQGVTNSSSGELVWSPILSVTSIPIGQELKRQFGVPVSINNDCGLIAKALHQRAHKSLGDNFVTVLFSHGIGLGVYLAGKPFTGAHTSALELGHIQFEKDGALCRCGKRGCIEAYAADYGVLRTATQLSPTKIPSGPVSSEKVEQLIDAAKNGGKQEAYAFELAGKAIGTGLATVFTLLDPLPIALVGHSSDAVDLMRPEIENALRIGGPSSTKDTDYSQLLHCFHENAPLLLDGLTLEAMSIVDRVFAEYTDEIALG